MSPRHRWMLLLVASYYFYMAWRPIYAILILFSTSVDYVAALAIPRTSSQAGRRGWLLSSLAANLGLLFVFKYYNFVGGSLRDFTSLNVPLTELLLPVGISSYTFQSLGYTIDVYRGRISPESHFGYFALYVSFFPQLVAGPIERARQLIPQLRNTGRFDYANAADGLKLIAWGFFQKVVIADRLAIVVDHVYSNPGGHSGPALAFATFAFGFQILCDFGATPASPSERRR